jgi:hypothetical protein
MDCVRSPNPESPVPSCPQKKSLSTSYPRHQPVFESFHVAGFITQSQIIVTFVRCGEQCLALGLLNNLYAKSTYERSCPAYCNGGRTDDSLSWPCALPVVSASATLEHKSRQAPCMSPGQLSKSYNHGRMDHSADICPNKWLTNSRMCELVSTQEAYGHIADVLVKKDTNELHGRWLGWVLTSLCEPSIPNKD